MFTENTLREDIVKTWGSTGAHIELFDRILKIAVQNYIPWPLTIFATPPGTVAARQIVITKETTILFDRNIWSMVLNNLAYRIDESEIKRIWPLIKFKNIVGKRGAFFSIGKPNK